MSGRVAVVGYASTDRAVLVNTLPMAGATSLVLRSLTSGGRPGGMAYTATALARSRLSTSAVSWVGDDAVGRDYRELLVSAGVDVAGLAVSGHRSPTSILCYTEDGTATCIYDPGEINSVLTSDQQTVLRAASAVVVMIAPAEAVKTVLDRRTPDQELAWILKNDVSALDDELTARLARAATIIFCNRNERRLLSEHPPNPGVTTIVTDGPRSVEIIGPDGTRAVEVPSRIANTIDPTGAGDTFAGAVLGALWAGTKLDQALGIGFEAAAKMLERRREDNGCR